jgi:hypothetical protein
MRNGKLINNLSASDLKGVTQTNMFRLEAPIHQILSTGKKVNEFDLRNARAHFTPIVFFSCSCLC